MVSRIRGTRSRDDVGDGGTGGPNLRLKRLVGSEAGRGKFVR